MVGFEVKTDLEKVIIDLLRVDTVLDCGRNLERHLAGTCKLGSISPTMIFFDHA